MNEIKNTFVSNLSSPNTSYSDVVSRRKVNNYTEKSSTEDDDNIETIIKIFNERLSLFEETNKKQTQSLIDILNSVKQKIKNS